MCCSLPFATLRRSFGRLSAELCRLATVHNANVIVGVGGIIRCMMSMPVHIPDLELAHTPTPLHALPNFQAALQSECGSAIPDIYVKREDLTGFGFGGNKARHMGISFARFLDEGIETVVNINHYHSNQARFIAAACAKVGMECHLVAFDMVDAPLNGNLLLAKLFGARIHRVPSDYAREVAERLQDDARGRGRRTIIYPDHEITDIAGMMAFFMAGAEIDDQLGAHGLDRQPMHLWGLTGRSLAGLKLYSNHAGQSWKATAVRYTPLGATVSCCDADAEFAAQAVDRSSKVAEMLGLSGGLGIDDVSVLNGYAGPAYGVPDDGVMEAMHMLAKTEGIVLDPNYTGKSMSGLIGEIRRGALDSSVPVLFIHSGGLPQVFAHADKVWRWDGSD